MTIQVEQFIAKNGEKAIKINGYSLYSSYNPTQDAMRYISKEMDINASGYILLGLGLGYHLHALIEQNESNKPIISCCFNEQEIELYESNKTLQQVDYSSVTFVNRLQDLVVDETYQIIMPQVWLQIIGELHPLYNILLEIKMKQKTYKKFAGLMEQNFLANVALNEFNLDEMSKSIDLTKIACLVSAGPSLNETVGWLKEYRESTYILCVGAALKVLISNGIKPDAVIITDPSVYILEQVFGRKYQVSFYYLSTVYPEVIDYFTGKRCILLQEGYTLAENFAKGKNYPLLETGGSVATTGLSLLEFLGFNEIVLFGQDLGFKGTNTHAKLSSSNTVVSSKMTFLKVQSNNNEYISTLPNLVSFKNWFERKIKKSRVKVYTTALNGAKINGVKYISREEFVNLVRY